jgi:hypothetical protein
MFHISMHICMCICTHALTCVCCSQRSFVWHFQMVQNKLFLCSQCGLRMKWWTMKGTSFSFIILWRNDSMKRNGALIFQRPPLEHVRRIVWALPLLFVNIFSKRKGESTATEGMEIRHRPHLLVGSEQTMSNSRRKRELGEQIRKETRSKRTTEMTHGKETKFKNMKDGSCFFCLYSSL